MSINAASLARFGGKLAAAAQATFPATITVGLITLAAAARLGKTTRIVEASGIAIEIDGIALLPYSYGGSAPTPGMRLQVDGAHYRVAGVSPQAPLSAWELWLEEVG